MTETLRKEIHARHIAFLDRLKQKAVEAQDQTIKSKTLKTEKEKKEHWVPVWKQRALEICVKHDVPWPDIMKQNRVAKIVRARQEICWDMVVNLNMSFYGAGMKLDRDHSTIVHAVKRHKKLLEAQENECE